MAKSGSNRVLGLYVGPNQLEGPQDGAYVSLQNCVIKDKDVVEPRFGVSVSTLAAFGGSGSSNRVTQLHASSVGDGFAHWGTSTGASVSSPLSSTAILTNVPPPETWLRTRFADSRGRCYFTSDAGLRRIDSDSTGTYAGGLEVLAGGGQLAAAGYNTSGFLPLDSAVRYRALLARRDALKREIVGPGSGSAIIRVPPSRTASAGGVVRATNVTTVTTTAAHGFRPTDAVYMTFDAADTGASEFTTGLKTITLVPTATTFKFDDVAADYTSTAAATAVLGPATGNLVLYLDDLCAAGDILRVYRSEYVSPHTAMPSEDVYQIYEAILTAADVSNGYKVVIDNTPEVLLGDPAYFSPSVEGEAGNNSKPPRCADVCAVGGSLLLGNLRYPHALEIRLIATGGASGVIEGTVLTFTRGAENFTMTAAGQTNTVGVGEFAIYSGDTVAKDNERTAQAIVDGINVRHENGTNTFVDAFYVSGANDAPGIIRLVAKDFSTTGFTVTSDKGTAWSPQILNSGTATSSVQENAVSSCSESKPGLPDAHPLLSRYEVGEPNEKVMRVLAVRDNKALILKERSVWLRSGIWPNIRLDLIDDTLTFAFPDTAAVLDGTVYVLSSQGVVGITEGGVSGVGVPVSGFTDFLEDEEMNFSTADAWGVVDKALGVYILFIGTEAETDTTSRALVYSPSARAWSGPWAVDWTAYARNISTGRVAVGLPDVPRIAIENTGGGDARGATAFTVASQPSATTLTFADTSQMTVGDMLQFTFTVGPSSTPRRWIITEISGVTVTVNVSHGSIFTPGTSSVRLLKGFECVAEPVPLHAGGNGADAQVADVVLLMDRQAFQSATVAIAGGDVGQAYKTGKTLSRWGWGDGTWGDAPWGDYDGIRPERVAVPAESQRAPFHQVRLTVREAGARWRLHGVQLEFEPGSVKGRR